MLNLALQAQGLLDRTRAVDFLGPLLMRLYLVPIMWMAGTSKAQNFSGTVEWFGNPDWGLGLPLPWLMAFLATATEVVGAVFLLFGIAIRWISVPLMATMAVAALTVHLQNGWLTIAVSDGNVRLERARSILQEYGNYEWLTENGNFVVLNNGIELAATYFIMLLVLFFVGGGRYVSVDHWVGRWVAGRHPQ